MKIISWNVRGLGNGNKRRIVREGLLRSSPDIIILQETKLMDVDRAVVSGVWGSRFREWCFLPSVGSRGGIIIAWDVRKVKVVESLIGNYSVSIKIMEEDNIMWWLSGVYGPATYHNREEFWEELAALFGLCEGNWCVGGDFNVVRQPEERSTGASMNASMVRFNEVINEMGLMDPPLVNYAFKWTNLRDNPVASKIDRFLFTSEWDRVFPSSRQSIGVRTTSDHFPLILDTKVVKWGPSLFRFENVWLESPFFKSSISEWWKGFNGQGGP